MTDPFAWTQADHGQRTAGGECALLVWVDSRAPYQPRAMVSQTVLAALDHFGAPYRLLDLAQQRPTAEIVNGCACHVIAQEGLAGRLSAAEGRLLADAVAGGCGLVSYDWDLRAAAGPLLEMFGFEGVGRLPFASNLLRVPANDHYITWLQPAGALHQPRRMISARLAIERWRGDVLVLAEALLGKDQLIYSRHLVPGNAYEPGHYPVLFATRWGRGRAVQYTISPRLWKPGGLGHPGSLDDLFWRSIVWAARKPFVANPVPPFVTLSIDDCCGRHAFAYLDICAAHRFRPLVALFTGSLRPQQLPALAGRVRKGDCLVCSHAVSYYDLGSFDFGVGEYGDAALAGHFTAQDAFFAALGAGPSRTLRPHWGEIGVRALPYFKQRGQTLLCLPAHLGETKADQWLTEPGEGYWPYDSTRCFYDTLPDDRDFFTFGAFDDRQALDFLTGATVVLQEAPANDTNKAVEGVARQLRLGLGSGFYAELMTHEQKIGALSLAQWDQIMGRAGQLAARYDPLYADHDTIGAYLQAKHGTWLAQAGVRGVVLSGQASVPLKLSLFTDQDEGCERRYVDVAPFSGRIDAGV